MRNLRTKLSYALYIVLCIGGIYGLIAFRNATAYRDVDKLKTAGVEYVENMKMSIVNYDGFQGDMIHGGFVWYKVRDEKGYLYELAIGEWNGEIMTYNMKCLNAVSNQ